MSTVRIAPACCAPILGGILASTCAIALVAKFAACTLANQCPDAIGYAGVTIEAACMALLWRGSFTLAAGLSILFSAASCIVHLTGMLGTTCNCLGWLGTTSSNATVAYAATQGLLAATLFVVGSAARPPTIP